MAERRTDFPWLDAHISYLEHRLYEATMQVNDQAYSGKVDLAAQKWSSDTREELSEFQYIKRAVSPQPIKITGWHLLAYALIMAMILLAYLQFFGG